MRVRLFVDPSKASSTEIGEGVCQDLEYVKALGKRIKDAGFAFMLDFHYSDSWADPAKQYTPDAWKSLDDDALVQQIYDYTKASLQELVAAGATPDFIQTGNEISYGMLWGTKSGTPKKYYAGQASNRERFTNLLKSAGEACREVCPQAKIILHIERVPKPDYAINFYKDMNDASVDYDIMGLSYYPYYHGYLAQLDKAITQLETAYADKEIMVVETGYSYHYAIDGTYDYTSTYPLTDEGQLNFTKDMITRLNKHEKVTGLFWWMMEANEYGLDWNTQRVTDQWYNASLFDNETGKATSALSALKEFAPTAGVNTVTVDETDAAADVFTIDGRLVSSHGDVDKLPAGIYIVGGKKKIVK